MLSLLKNKFLYFQKQKFKTEKVCNFSIYLVVNISGNDIFELTIALDLLLLPH